MEEMDRVVESLILDLIEWLADRDRTYEEVMDAWRTSCPRLQFWEEANGRGLVMIQAVGERSFVRVTNLGFVLLERRKGAENVRAI